MLYLKRFFFNAATVNIKQSLVKDATNVETANGCSKVQDEIQFYWCYSIMNRCCSFFINHEETYVCTTEIFDFN